MIQAMRDFLQENFLLPLVDASATQNQYSRDILPMSECRRQHFYQVFDRFGVPFRQEARRADVS